MALLSILTTLNYSQVNYVVDMRVGALITKFFFCSYFCCYCPKHYIKVWIWRRL